LQGNWTLILYRTLPNVAQVAYEKQNNTHINNKPPQPHKIEARKAKNSSNLLRFKNLSKNHQTSHIKQKKGLLASRTETKKRKKDFCLGFKLIT
jgi:hypothetical protein